MLGATLDNPSEWDFFQALREIERAFPESARLGTSTTLRDDPVRFGQYISMSCESTALQAWSDVANSKKKLLVRFMGLTGSHGPLPLVLTEFVRSRLVGVDDPDMPRTAFGPAADRPQSSRRDPVLAEFLDLFHHRLICLFYRAWALANKAVDFDRDDNRFFAEWIASLFGEGCPEFDGADDIPAWQKLAFAGALSSQTRPLSGLRGLLAAAFATPCEVEALVGQWVEIPCAERCRLGESRRTGQLGASCVIGSRFWDRQQKFGVRLGPMPLTEFVSFLPEASHWRPLQNWIAYYTRRQYSWQVAIVLDRKEVPRLNLGGDARQLGRTAWLSSRPFSKDPDDFCISDSS